jgi:uncharacterized protein (TIGR02145 family)
MKNIIPLLFLLVISCSKNEDSDINQPYGTMVDSDGNTYKTLKIGNQTWMLENLKTTKYNDGTPIPKYEFPVNWSSTAYYQWANTEDLNNVYPEDLPFDYYGAMYNDIVLESGKLAPSGWRIPSKQDFEILENYLKRHGYNGNEGKALKSKTGWHGAGFGNDNDAIGFKGLPNGYVDIFGGAKATEIICTWATSNKNLGNFSRTVVNLTQDENTIIYSENDILMGAGVRCIKE